MQEGFDSMDLARGLESGSGTPESESERALPAIGAQDMVDVRRGEEGRGREEVDTERNSLMFMHHGNLAIDVDDK